MTAQPLHYRAGDVDAVGFLVHPGGEGLRPAVLVAHEGPGLDEHARNRARMLGDLGYVALAADLYGQGYVAATHEETVERVVGLRARRDVLRTRIRAGLEALRGVSGVDPARVAAIGYCFGGMAVLELARSGASLSGVVSFHGLLDCENPAEAVDMTCPILICTGSADILVPRDQVAVFEDEMSAANVDWQVIRYGGAKHAFTNHVEAETLAKLGFGYDERADRRSWQAMRVFLGEVFTRAR